MTVDPDSLEERNSTVSRSDLKMDDGDDLEEVADIDPKLLKEFDL